MNRFSCPCLGAGTRGWGAGTHGAGAWCWHVAGKDLWALGVSCLFLLKPGAKFIPRVAATQPGMNVTHFAAFVSPCQKGDTV